MRLVLTRVLFSFGSFLIIMEVPFISNGLEIMEGDKVTVTTELNCL